MFIQHKTIKYKSTPLQKKYSLSVLHILKSPILLDNNAIKVYSIKMTERVLNKSSNKNIGTIYLELLAQYKMIQKL